MSSTPGSFLPSRGNTRVRTPNLWSAEELRRLREMALRRMPLHLIAGALRRSESAIRNKAAMHGISLRAATPSEPAQEDTESRPA